MCVSPTAWTCWPCLSCASQVRPRRADCRRPRPWSVSEFPALSEVQLAASWPPLGDLCPDPGQLDLGGFKAKRQLRSLRQSWETGPSPRRAFMALSKGPRLRCQPAFGGLAGVRGPQVRQFPHPASWVPRARRTGCVSLPKLAGAASRSGWSWGNTQGVDVENALGTWWKHLSGCLHETSVLLLLGLGVVNRDALCSGPQTRSCFCFRGPVCGL